jgi:hypothetical protein
VMVLQCAYDTSRDQLGDQPHEANHLELTFSGRRGLEKSGRIL